MIGGAGFAMMAWRLARSRVPHSSPKVRYYMTRDGISATNAPASFPVHREYYRIIDLAWSFRKAVKGSTAKL